VAFGSPTKNRGRRRWDVDHRLFALAIPLALLTIPRGGGLAAEPKRALIVGAGTDSSPSGAFQARLGVYPLNTNVAEPLVRLTPEYSVEPLLATRWEYVGKNTWRFFLRRGVKFHDGQLFTAAAVRWSIAEQVRQGLASAPLTEDAVRVVDDYTVDITTTETDLRLPEQLVHPNYGIFALKSDPRSKPIGTGPFRFVDYQPHQEITVARFDGYWGTKALPHRITFRFLPDATTRVLALIAGEVDLSMDIPREQLGAIASKRGISVARARVGQVMSLNMNAHGRPPYDQLTDRALRRAIAFSIDRRQLVRQIWQGEAEVIQTVSVPAILGPYAERVKGFGVDRAQAGRLLDGAGWKMGEDGIRRKGSAALRLTLISNPEVDPATVEFVQGQLRTIGIDVKWAKSPDLGSFAARTSAGEFNLAVATANQNDANPMFLPALIYDSRSKRPFARWYHLGPALDRIIDAGLQAMDSDEVCRRAAEAIAMIVDEEAIALPLAGLFRIYAMKSSVEGFVPHPSQTNQTWTAVYLK